MQRRLYHLGVAPARRSTLADANARRPAAVFAALFAVMAAGPIAGCAGAWPRPPI